jgi:hypothetical protein
MITGYLTGYALTDLIRFLYSQKESGELLMVVEDAAPKGIVGFKHGKVIFAKFGLKMSIEALFELSKSESFMFIFDSKSATSENIYKNTDELIDELYRQNEYLIMLQPNTLLCRKTIQSGMQIHLQSLKLALIAKIGNSSKFGDVVTSANLPKNEVREQIIEMIKMGLIGVKSNEELFGLRLYNKPIDFRLPQIEFELARIIVNGIRLALLHDSYPMPLGLFVDVFNLLQIREAVEIRDSSAALVSPLKLRWIAGIPKLSIPYTLNVKQVRKILPKTKTLMVDENILALWQTQTAQDKISKISAKSLVYDGEFGVVKAQKNSSYIYLSQNEMKMFGVAEGDKLMCKPILE